MEKIINSIWCENECSELLLLCQFWTGKIDAVSTGLFVCISTSRNWCHYDLYFSDHQTVNLSNETSMRIPTDTVLRFLGPANPFGSFSCILNQSRTWNANQPRPESQPKIQNKFFSGRVYFFSCFYFVEVIELFVKTWHFTEGEWKWWCVCENPSSVRMNTF